MSKNKDLIKSISDRFIKPRQENEEQTEVTEIKPEVTEFTPISNKVALDVTKVGKDYLVIEIEYNLDTMEAKVLSSTVLDNRVVGLSFQHGRSGLESITNRTKKHMKLNEGKVNE